MFTGLIQGMGIIKAKTTLQQPLRYQMTLKVPQTLRERYCVGDSLAVDGVCLTAVALRHDAVVVELMAPTRRKTTLWQKPLGAVVNLERPLAINGLLEGHLVQGHVDTMVKVEQITTKGDELMLGIQRPAAYAKEIVAQGSVAVNGVSLTVVKTTPTRFYVGIIAHTQKMTNLALVRTGTWVNLETDLLAKYLWRGKLSTNKETKTDGRYEI